MRKAGLYLFSKENMNHISGIENELKKIDCEIAGIKRYIELNPSEATESNTEIEQLNLKKEELIKELDELKNKPKLKFKKYEEDLKFNTKLSVYPAEEKKIYPRTLVCKSKKRKRQKTVVSVSNHPIYPGNFFGNGKQRG